LQKSDYNRFYEDGGCWGNRERVSLELLYRVRRNTGGIRLFLLNSNKKILSRETEPRLCLFMNIAVKIAGGFPVFWFGIFKPPFFHGASGAKAKR
jgi:hypothetical protein